MTLTMPIMKKNLPTSVSSFAMTVNGRLVLAREPDVSLLRDPGDGLGPLLEIPSYGMQALHLRMKEHGITLETTGRGRSLARQTQVFLERMTPTYDPAINVVEDQRTIVIDQRHIHPDLVPGKRWYKRRGKAAIASPSTSNHGFYAADDLSEEYDGDTATDPLRSTTLQLLYQEAPKFGWAWELASEPWHVHWIGGDEIPPMAKIYLKKYGIPFPGEEEEDMLKLIDPAPVRAYSTRSTDPGYKNQGPLAANERRVVTLPYATDAVAALVNVKALPVPTGTVLKKTRAGWLRLIRGDLKANVAVHSDVNWEDGQTIAGMEVSVAVSGGKIIIESGPAPFDVIIDVKGYYVA